MEVTGYKYTNEQDAIQARQDCADFYGLPKSPEDETIYWVNYNTATEDNPIFWYIVFDESIRAILGEPITFEVNELPTE
jgi:hypothetical protein